MNFVTRILATSIATACLGLAIGAAVTPPTEAAGVSKPKIETVYPEKAPSKSGKGGFALPFVESSYGWDYDGIRATTTVYTTKNQYVTSRTNNEPELSYTGEIRLKPGTYKVKTVAVERSRSATRWQTITIKVKTDSSTISKGEYKRIKKGMTKKQVKKIAGSKVPTRSYEMIERSDYRQYANLVWTKGGRVKSKSWYFPGCY